MVAAFRCRGHVASIVDMEYRLGSCHSARVTGDLAMPAHKHDRGLEERSKCAGQPGRGGVSRRTRSFPYGVHLQPGKSDILEDGSTFDCFVLELLRARDPPQDPIIGRCDVDPPLVAYLLSPTLESSTSWRRAMLLHLSPSPNPSNGPRSSPDDVCPSHLRG